MTDTELLELAAKAAGIDSTYCRTSNNGVYTDCALWWNPLADDGDALRLSVALSIGVFRDSLGAYCNYHQTKQLKIYFSEVPDPLIAVRRAIVCAAAEIGKEMR